MAFGADWRHCSITIAARLNLHIPSYSPFPVHRLSITEMRLGWAIILTCRIAMVCVPPVNVAGQLADKASLFHSIQHMIAVRKKTSVFGRGNITWLESNNPSVSAYVREYADDSLLILNNLSSSVQTIRLPVEHHGTYVDLLGGATLAVRETTPLQ